MESRKQGAAMMLSLYLSFLIILMNQGCVSGESEKTLVVFMGVELGDKIMLNCSYNCASGFIRKYWEGMSERSFECGANTNNIICIASLCLSNVTTEDINKNYTCYTEDTDDTQLAKKVQRIFFLHLREKRSVSTCTVTPNLENTTDDSTAIKVTATATVIAALTALVAYVCVHWYKDNHNEHDSSRATSPHPKSATLPVKGTLPIQGERVTLRIPQPDNESDTEVPYADIMITIRGVSTPELTQVGCLATGESWADACRSHLQASRSADRLHVPQPREIGRKMSTSSEYAVITYA